MSALDAFIQDINEQKETALLLGKVTRLWASLPQAEWQDFDRELERVVELVSKEGAGVGARCSRWRSRCD